MVLAFGMVISLQNIYTGNGQIPGCSCILSVATAQVRLLPSKGPDGGLVPGLAPLQG